MKTTINLADDLAIRLKERTKAQGISIRAAVNQALGNWLDDVESKVDRPQLSRKIGTVAGHGLSTEAQGLSWDQLRELSYQDDE